MSVKSKLSEHAIQSAFFDWVYLSEKKHPILKLLFAVPNAGKRSYQVARWLKNEGLRSGVLDVLFCVARKGYIGLALEFKIPGKNIEPGSEQETFAVLLQSQGWLVVVVTKTEDAIRIVKNYLDI